MSDIQLSWGKPKTLKHRLVEMTEGSRHETMCQRTVFDGCPSVSSMGLHLTKRGGWPCHCPTSQTPCLSIICLLLYPLLDNPSILKEDNKSGGTEQVHTCAPLRQLLLPLKITGIRGTIMMYDIIVSACILVTSLAKED